MPELPEVETVRRTLRPALGARIVATWTSRKALRMGQVIPRRKLRALVGARIVAIRRLGKYLWIDTDGDTALIVHLGMSGRLRVQPADSERPPHTHVALALDGKRELRFSDPRRFGQFDVAPAGDPRSHPALASMGPDPIAERLSADYLFRKSRGRTSTVKAFILDQTVIAGIGNIYASEALWHSKIAPTLAAGDLTEADSKHLTAAIVRVLQLALKRGGTSLRDFVNADGVAGENAAYLLVYGRTGSPCPKCGKAIRRTIVAGRATFHCSRCQALPGRHPHLGRTSPLASRR